MAPNGNGPARLLAGSWDCHFHILGSDETGVAALLAAHQAMGVEHGVLVQSTTQSLTDFTETLAETGNRYLGVIVPTPELTDAELLALSARGVAGARFSHGKTGALDLGLVARIAARGWIPHFGLKASEHFENWRKPLLGLGQDFVVEHSGWPDIEAGVEGAGFRQLLDWLDSGRCWVKLSARFSRSQRAPFADVVAYNTALLKHAPERMLWGSDWPYTGYPEPLPPAEASAASALSWTGHNEAGAARMLVTNPSQLFGPWTRRL